MTRRTLIQACLAVVSGGLHAAQAGLAYIDRKPEYGSWPTKRVSGNINFSTKVYEFFDDCGRRIHPVGWIFRPRWSLSRDRYRGCLHLCFISPGSPSADNLYYESSCYEADLTFLGEHRVAESYHAPTARFALWSDYRYGTPEGPVIWRSLHHSIAKYEGIPNARRS